MTHYLNIGNNKRITYGGYWFAVDNDASIGLLISADRLVNLLGEREYMFIDKFSSLNLIQTRCNYGIFHRDNSCPMQASWNFENPQFDPQREAILKNIVSDLLRINVLGEVKFKPNFINPVDIIYKNGEWKLWPDYSFLSQFELSRSNTTRFLNNNIFDIPTSAIFTKLVIKDAAYQISLKENCRMYTSFQIRYDNAFRYFRFNTLHPNFKNTKFHIQRLVDGIVSTILGESVRALEDHILISTQDFETHLSNLETVLSLLNRANVKLSLRESLIMVKELELFDYWIDARGISISSSTKEKIRNSESTTKENRDLFRQTIRNYARFCNDQQNYVLNLRFLEENQFRSSQENWNRYFNWFKRTLLNAVTVPFRFRTRR